MMDNPGRALGVAELLRHYPPHVVAEMLSRADKGDISGALDLIFPKPDDDHSAAMTEDES